MEHTPNYQELMAFGEALCAELREDGFHAHTGTDNDGDACISIGLPCIGYKPSEYTFWADELAACDVEFGREYTKRESNCLKKMQTNLIII